MKIPPISVTKKDIDNARKPTPWDLGNQVLYDMCSKYPRHKTSQEAIAKIWLIGRSYAAAIERRRNGKHGSDDFYIETVGPTVAASNIDTLLSSLPRRPAAPVEHLAKTIKTHKKIMDLFESMTGMEKRSLASKYLHFHRPDLFFIYDSRAQAGIRKLTPSCRYIDHIPVLKHERDQEYYKFCIRMAWLSRNVQKRHARQLTPRELDNVLLAVHERIQ